MASRELRPPVTTDGFSDDFLPLLDETLRPAANEPIFSTNIDTIELQHHVVMDDKRASVVLDDHVILLNEPTPKDAFVDFICSQPSSHTLQLSLQIPLQTQGLSLVDVTYDNLHQQTNGLTPAALLDVLKTTNLFPYIVSLAQFEHAIRLHGLNPILTLRNFQDIATTWAGTNEPLLSIVSQQPQRLQVLLRGLNGQLDMDILSRCKAEVQEQVWVKAAAKYDHSMSKSRSAAASFASPRPKVILTPKQTQAFMARMQSDLATRREKEQERAAERHRTLIAHDQIPPHARGGISQGSVRILEKNGWLNATSSACIERMLRAKGEQLELNKQERERNLMVDARTGQRLYRPQVNMQHHMQQKRQGGHVYDELYALAKQKALKAEWMQEQREFAINATMRRSVQLNSASKKRCHDRFEKDFDRVLTALGVQETVLSKDAMAEVLTQFGLPSTANDVANIQADLSNGVGFRTWMKSIVLNEPKCHRSDVWKRYRRQYISRSQPTLAQRPAPIVHPSAKTPKKASGQYTLHGKAVEAEDPLSERHQRETIKVHELRQHLEDSATVECTFTPVIHSRCHRDSSRDIGHHLYELAVEKRAKQLEHLHKTSGSPGTGEFETSGGTSAMDRLEAFYAVTAEQEQVVAFDKAVENMRQGQKEKARKAEKTSAAIAKHLRVEAMRSADGRHTIPQPFNLHLHHKPNQAARHAKKSRLLRQFGCKPHPADTFVNVHIAPALDHSIELSHVHDSNDVDDVIAAMTATYSLDSVQVAGLESALHDFAGLDFSHVH
ncbi:hypothetical protein, variant [Aphanomyces invadans]|nr:hypothetical protein, variant [Aphanomyces invadans]ETV90445.1 hypothetical protein, variant [Aphanomyces invadans]|eukprot:XP_008880919.1 hypothetical protein, variant [Aphanomyces invadans]